jgi:hypothetical protein
MEETSGSKVQPRKKGGAGRVILWIFILGLLGIAGYFTYLYLFPKTGTNAMHMIPRNAIFIIETDEPVENWKRVSSSKTWQHLKTNEFFAELGHNADALDSLISSNDKLFSILGSRKTLISAHKTRAKDYDFLFVADLGMSSNFTFVKDYLSKVMDVYNYKLTKRGYQGQEILELYDRASRETIVLSFIDNQMVCSYSPSLVEASINEHGTPQLSTDPDFIEIGEKLSNGSMFNLYIQYSFFDDYMRIYMDDDNGSLKDLSEALLFSGMNVDLKDETMRFEGYTSLNDSVDSYLKAMIVSGRGERGADRILSERTAYYFSIGFESFPAFYSNFEREISRNKARADEYNLNIAKIEKLLKINVKEHFMSWIGEEVALAQMEPDSLTLSEGLVVALKASDIEKAKDNLKFIGKQIRKRLPVKFKEKEYNGYVINYLEMKGMFKLMFGKLFSKLEKPYYTIIDDYVLFSNSPVTLEKLIDDYMAEKTLDKNDAYSDFSSSFKSSSNVYVYLNPVRLHPVLKSYANAATWTKIKKNRQYITGFSHVGFQLSGDDNIFDTKLIIMSRDMDAEATAPEVKDTLPDSLSNIEHQILDQLTDTNALREFYEDGQVKSEVPLKSGIRDGVYLEYHENGKPKVKGRFVNGKEDGIWKYYDEDGEYLEKKKYRDGVLVEGM